MSHFTTQEIADLAGISKRHVQRLLSAGDIVPGAFRTKGGHWRIPDSPELRAWAKGFSKWEGKPRRPDYDGVPLVEWKATSNPVAKVEVTEDSIKALSAAVADAQEAIQRLDVCRKAAGMHLLLLREEKRSGFKRWIREHLAPLDVEEATWLAGSARRSPSMMETLKKLNCIPGRKTTIGQKERPPDSLAWIKWASKIRKSFPLERVETMDYAGRFAALKHLEPIKRLIAQLENS